MALCLNARYRTESFAFFTVRMGVNQKNGITNGLVGASAEFRGFFRVYGEDDPEARTLNSVNAGYNRPVRSKEAEHANWDPHAGHDRHTLRCVWYRPEGCTSSVGR